MSLLTILAIFGLSYFLTMTIGLSVVTAIMVARRSRQASKIAPPLLLLLVAACAHGRSTPATTAFTLVIDSSFATNEAQDIVSGADAWGAQVEDITWTFVIVDRPSIDKALETTPPPNTYYVIRTDTAAEIPPECVILDNNFGCAKDARIYLPEQDLLAGYDEFRIVIGHELGHTWNLQHSTFYNSIMRADLAEMAPVPSHEDAVAYCNLRGCPVHKDLHGGIP